MKLTNEQQEIFEVAYKKAIAECKDPYAQTYLRAMNLAISQYGLNGARVQILYCLSNMSYWRGQTAREVKQVFKDTIKILEK